MASGWTQAQVLVGAGLLGGATGVLTGAALSLVAQRRNSAFLRRTHRLCRWPWTCSLAFLAMVSMIPVVDLPDIGIAGVLVHVIEIGAITSVAWLVVSGLFVLEDIAFLKLRTSDPDDKRFRRARTQVTVLRRVTAVVVAFVGIGAALLSFPTFRTFGTTLLATAGIVGILAGVAAQSTLSNAIAGLQIAFTDSLRIGDVVVVEDEWGRVEQLTLTHVLVHLWDDRRLVLPTNYFTTQPFQNWTRDSANVTGAVTLHVDPSAPIQALRERSREIVESSPRWDRRTWVLQVVDMTESTAVIRVLASAADSENAFDLKCEIREELLRFLAEEHPDALPRLRVADRPPPSPSP